MGAKIWTAKFITGPIQAQCYSSGGVFSCRSRYHGISEGHERYAQVHQSSVCFGLPLGTEQSKKRHRERNMMKAVLCLLFCAAAVMAADMTVYEFTLNYIDGESAAAEPARGEGTFLATVSRR